MGEVIMKRILIMAIPNDYHAMAVRWGIEQLGGMVNVWVPGDLPDFGSVSMSVIKGETKIGFASQRSSFDADEIGVFWNRRFSTPTAPDDASPYDRRVIERESLEHLKNTRLLVSLSAIGINHPASQHVANHKVVQVATASAVGLPVAPTLFSNNYDDIRDFYAIHAPVIAKPYQQFSWVTKDGTLSHLTYDMPEPTENLRRSIEDCPMIIQKKVDRAFEVRLIIMGDIITAVKMVDCSDEGILDSRKAIRHGVMLFSIIDPPAAIAEACLRYTAALDVRIGIFDFIVDAEGVWYFLECNEHGQFLFLEQAVPETHLLDKFCRWLLTLSGADEANLADRAPLTIGDFESSARAAELRLEQDHHKKRVDPANVSYEEIPDVVAIG